MHTYNINKRVSITYLTHKKSSEIDSLNDTPAIVICPGGGYGFHSDREAEYIGKQYYAKGFAFFIVRYSLIPHASYPNSILDLMEAIKFVKQNYTKLNINKDLMYALGFSAGGHVVGSYATQYFNNDILKLRNLNEEDIKVNAVLLGYPVLTTEWMKSTPNEYMEYNVKEQLLNNNYEYEEYLNVTDNVSEKTLPSFVFHARDDDLVPVTDSFEYVAKLNKYNIYYSLHIYESGGHGFGLGDNFTTNIGYDLPVYGWFELSVNFIKNIEDSTGN